MPFDKDYHDAIGREIRSSSTVLARAMVDRQYAEDPEPLKKFGKAGYDKSVSDAVYNLECLAESISLGDPAVFFRHIEWLQGVLTHAGVPPEILQVHCTVMAAELARVLPADMAAIAGTYISKAMEVFEKKNR